MDKQWVRECFLTHPILRAMNTTLAEPKISIAVFPQFSSTLDRNFYAAPERMSADILGISVSEDELGCVRKCQWTGTGHGTGRRALRKIQILIMIYFPIILIITDNNRLLIIILILLHIEIY